MRVLKGLLLALLLIAIAGSLLLAVIVHRGFRASETPTAAEATVARALRKFAIPGRERRRKNPLEGNSQALAHGRRNFFLAECASCHGIDGRGKTQIGVNLYPRVPDLRSPRDAKSVGWRNPLHYREWRSTGVPGTFVHAHTFRSIPPQMTDKYKIPNSCTTCHKDKSTAWAEGAIKQWSNYSPWHL